MSSPTTHNAGLEHNKSQYTFQQRQNMEPSSIQQNYPSAFTRKTLSPTKYAASQSNTTTEARNATYHRGPLTLPQSQSRHYQSPDTCVMDIHGSSRLEATGEDMIVTPQASPRAARRPNSQYFRAPPYASTSQHPCSCHECCHHYWQCYSSYYRSYGYEQPWHPRDATRATENDRPIFRRRMSAESSRPQTFASRDEAKRSLRRNDGPAEEAIDASDIEVEMITSGQKWSHRNHHAYPHVSSHHYHHQLPSYLPYHHNPYYYPHHGYHSYYENGNYYPTASNNVVSRKRKKYDEFLLRPKKDYIIYADRSNSRMSDITASPAPSLSGFEISDIEELGKHDRKQIAIDVNAPVLNVDFKRPSLKRRRNDREDKFDFNEEVDDIVRTVSPAKSKELVPKKKVNEDGQVWRDKSNNDNFAVTISKKVSHSYSE